MSGRVKRGWWTEDGRWIQYWQTLGDPVEEPSERVDYTAELILAMSTLTDKQRFVIECRYGLRPGCPEMTVCEIAVVMGVSHVAVVRLIQRGLMRLRKGLQESPIDAWTQVLAEEI